MIWAISVGLLGLLALSIPVGIVLFLLGFGVDAQRRYQGHQLDQHEGHDQGERPDDDEAAKLGDIFITATGMKDVIRGRHFASMRDGAIVCNTGHYDCEINIPELEEMAASKRDMRADNEEYRLPDGRRIYLLAQGRLVNLAAAEGHPSEVMDMSFANQFLSQLRLAELAKKGKRLDTAVHDIPEAQDQEIGALKLKTMGYKIDKLIHNPKVELAGLGAKELIAELKVPGQQ